MKLKDMLLIMVIGLAVFGNGLVNNFVGDDFGQVVENPLVHRVSNIPLFFAGSTFYNGATQVLTGGYYKPLLITYFSVIYTFFGENSWIFHLGQLVMHIVNTCLVLAIFRKFFNDYIAIFLALVFLIHPINSEAVLYISDTQEVMFLMFGLTAFRLVQNWKDKNIGVIGLSILLAIMAKETGLAFLGIVLTYIWLFKREKIWITTGVTTGVLAVYAYLRLQALGWPTNGIANSPIERLPLLIRLINVPEIVWFYIKTFFWPQHLAYSYQWIETKITMEHFGWPLFGEIGAILAIAVLGKKLWRNKSFGFFAIWAFLGLGLHLQIIALDATVAERWFYLPMIGILGMLGVVLTETKMNVKTSGWRIPGLIILLILGSRTVIRSFDFRNDYTLATHDIQVSPEAYGLESLLSTMYMNQEKWPEAKKHAQISINYFPYTSNYTNLGAIDMHMGNLEAANTAYLAALKYGDYYKTYENLAFLKLVYGDPVINISEIKTQYLRKFPNDAKLWLCLAALEYNYGDKNQAKTEINKAYLLDQGGQISAVYSAIMNNQPVKLVQ